MGYVASVYLGECTEAGSDDFVAPFTRCESNVTRSDRVSVILHEPQSCCTTRNSQNSQGT